MKPKPFYYVTDKERERETHRERKIKKERQREGERERGIERKKERE